MKKNTKWDLGLRAEFVIRMNDDHVTVEEDQFIGVHKDRINFIGKFKPAFKNNCKKFIEKKNHVLIPGLVNGHTHLPMSLFRGVEDDVPLKVWLFERIFPLEAKLVNKAFVTAGVELSALECIRFGVTTVNDMYFFAEEALKVWEKMGLRGLFSQVFLSFPTPEDKIVGGKFESKKVQFEKLLKKYKNHPRLNVGIAPHAPYSCDPELLTQIKDLSLKHQARIHIHVAETQSEVEESLKKFGKTPVQHLFDLGVLSELTNCAHCVHLTDQDIDLLKQSMASVTYNPDSNTKLSSGVAPIVRLIEKGVPVAFGTDGVASNNDLSLFGTMDLGTKLQKVSNPDSLTMTATQALKMATIDGAKALGLEQEIGSIEVGKKADLVFVDLNFPHLRPLNNLISHLVYSTQGLEVDTVICDGQVLLKDKKFVTKQAGAIFKKADKYQNLIKKEVIQLRSRKIATVIT